MIDLIIPFYKNKEALITSLVSIDFDVFNVIVVEDGSNEAFNLALDFPFKLIWLEENGGPGKARTAGLKHATNNYVMFLDAGDLFLSKEIQKKIEKVIDYHPEPNIFFWLYYHFDTLTKHTDNRLHGKVYKREFLDTYNITFCDECSYMNEDIGFNRTCRIISDAINIPIYYVDQPVIWQRKDENSLT